MDLAGTQMPALARLLRANRLQQIKILELGAGCGIVGIALASWFPNCVIQLTDQAEAQDILSRNLNQATLARSSSLQAWALDWNDESPAPYSERDLALVVVSDCTYNSDSCPDLVKTLTRISLTSPEVKILVATKRRHDSEKIFFDLMQDAQLNLLEKTIVHLPCAPSISDTTQPEIELYLYGLAKG